MHVHTLTFFSTPTSFSEAGLLLSYDTKGVVRSLSTSFQLMWQPILDCAKVLGKSKSDHYFIVGMTHNPAEMRYVFSSIMVILSLSQCRVILCKGMDYPAVLPRPVMSSLSLQVPLCEPQTEKTDTEVHNYNGSLLLLDECILSCPVVEQVSAAVAPPTCPPL